MVLYYLFFWFLFTDESEKLQEEYKKQPCHLERLYGLKDSVLCSILLP